MKLRTYLVKRTIHMMITLLIVLVLLFVLYRMMPGSEAASMMMQPGMTQVQIEMILVRYGYGRWVDLPGEYTVSNYQPQDIGRYSVTVEATGDDGQTDSFDTYFDVNAPASVDLLAPQILDIGLANATAGNEAELYLWVYDEGAIRGVDVFMQAPNLVVVDGVAVRHNETFSLNPIPSMSDEINKIYYFSGTSDTDLVVDAGGSSLFQLSFDVEDNARNWATAAIEFDANTGLETAKIYNLSADIPFSNNEYAYPDAGDSISLSSTIEGTGTPAFSMLMADITSSEVLSPTASGIWYNGTYTIPENGMLTYMVEMGDISAQYSFPVNSIGSMPAAVDDDDSSYPLLSNLNIMTINPDNGAEIPDALYPLILSELKISINATALDTNDKRCSIVTATILKPDGSSSEVSLSHPKIVIRRSTAEQFVIYMKTMLVFDFGTSYMYQRPTWEVLLERVPSTALLFGSALVLSYIVGISVGVLVAWRRGTVFEMSTIITTLFFYSMPIFWFALIMQWIFYMQLDWFPLGGMGGIDPSGSPLHGVHYLLDVLWHLTMPLITLMILGLAGNILLMRSAMLEVIGEDFTTTAKAKGLKERTVIYKHVARNAMLPVVTSMAMSIGGIISGGVLTETIFSWFGMGTLLIEATLTKDFPVVQGAFYVLALITILGNMMADMLYAWLDPRVQL